MRILIVEDHDDTRDALERFLSRCGYGVAVAADLRTALNLLQSQPFEAVVTDARFRAPRGARVYIANHSFMRFDVERPAVLR